MAKIRTIMVSIFYYIQIINQTAEYGKYTCEIFLANNDFAHLSNKQVY